MNFSKASSVAVAVVSFPGADELRPYDVMCGRDKNAFNYTGNRRFRVTIELNLPAYMRCKSRDDKTLLIFSIIDLVRSNGGRFIKRQNNKWVELTEHATRQKVGHCVRDMALRKKLIGDDTEESSSAASAEAPRSSKAKTMRRKLSVISKPQAAPTPPMTTTTPIEVECDDTTVSTSSSTTTTSQMDDEPLPMTMLEPMATFCTAPLPAMIAPQSLQNVRRVSLESSDSLSGCALADIARTAKMVSPVCPPGFLSKPRFHAVAGLDLRSALTTDNDQFNIRLDTECSAFENLYENGLDLPCC